jgi:A/G-specific adenine glycosylase
MLQQTTVTAVIPYYEKFLARFPQLADLAQSELADVLELWAGLGYYSRARALHKSAQALHARGGFPQTATALEELPGFGPYTSRAVASLAFGESVGVVDGNVIRVLSRLHALDLKWWTTKARREYQSLADELAQSADPYFVNQALMELGATICTPKSPTCLLCPWQSACAARTAASRSRRDAKSVTDYPRPRPKREHEIWIWRPRLIRSGSLVALLPNTHAPFLRGQLLPPGQAERRQVAPKDFTYRGQITHHKIFVMPEMESWPRPRAKLDGQPLTWVKREELSRQVPSSLVRRAFDAMK